MARLRVEFTVEPFADGAPGAHVAAAVAAADAAGLTTDFGPFSTVAEADEGAVLAAVARVLEAAFTHGATRISFQVERVGKPAS